MIGRLTPPGGLTITGTLRRSPPGTPYRVWNSLLALDHDGTPVATFDKSHLVPFGEYVPFRDLLDVAKVTSGTVDFSPGGGVQTLRLPGLPPVSPLICYEVIFPGKVVDPEDRPEWVLNITNDAWYGKSTGPYQHLASARLRAVEEGLPLVRVANTGISAIIDPWGRVVARKGLGEQGVVDGPLPAPLATQPVYARLGNWSTLLVVVASLSTGMLLSRRE
jgi:apolipoprotein N-acyltransferase